MDHLTVTIKNDGPVEWDLDDNNGQITWTPKSPSRLWSIDFDPVEEPPSMTDTVVSAMKVLYDHGKIPPLTASPEEVLMGASMILAKETGEDQRVILELQLYKAGYLDKNQILNIIASDLPRMPWEKQA